MQISELLNLEHLTTDILSNLVVKKVSPDSEISLNTKSTYIIMANDQHLHGSGAEQTRAFWNPAQILVAGAR